MRTVLAIVLAMMPLLLAAQEPAPADVQRTIAGRDLRALKAHPDWLEAHARTFSAQAEGDAMLLSAEGAGLGMKWSMPLQPGLDLTTVRFMSLRYRAAGLAPWGDYCVWLGGQEAGKPVEQSIMPISELQSDGEWHTVVVPVQLSFVANQLALQVSSRQRRGRLAIERIRFTRQRPQLAPADLLPVQAGHDGALLKAGASACVDLSAAANDSAKARMEGFGLSRWFGGTQVTVRGIPFQLPEGERNLVATPKSIDQQTPIPIGARGSELYLLMGVRLPEYSLTGMLGREPLRVIDSPERMRIVIRYADGVVDEALPLSVAAHRFEVRSGLDVYCIPGLRPVAVESIAVRNRMPSALLAIAGVTVNTGTAIAQLPEPLVLPAPVPQAPSQRRPGVRITPSPGGYVIVAGQLEMTLQTTDGIAVRSLVNRCLSGGDMAIAPGALFELGVGDTLVPSDRLNTAPARVSREADRMVLKVPFDAGAAVPMKGVLICSARPSGEIRMWLDLTFTGEKPAAPLVNFPTLRGLRLGTVPQTWYLWACKGGIISNRPTRQARYYGGEYPLQVADLFNPALGGGISLHTYDQDDLYKQWQLEKDAAGVNWSIDYYPIERSAGEKVPVAATALRAHTGDWRVALEDYRRWAQAWYRPAVESTRWFQECFNYRQHLAWSELYDRKSGTWRMDQVIAADRAFFGRIDYLHIFDFGESRKHGRVGDYNHYDELGGLEGMAAAVARAKELGVPVGLYIEGYLCDDRVAWGKENVLANDIRTRDGKSLLYPGTTSEHMMCPASRAWRWHLAQTYQRVAAQLHPSGMYIDQYGFGDTWKTCWSTRHGHAVPNPPVGAERGMLEMIRSAVPAGIATLTEETPNDVNSQYQDGALGYSVAFADPELAPHRVDLFRFQYPRFKVFQLVSYNNFVDGGWDLLKFPFFNGEGTWLGNGVPQGFCPDAQAFLRKAFALLHEHRDAFCSDDVEPLVQTLDGQLFANRFTAGSKTVWTLFNSRYATFRGDGLRVAHVAGRRYTDGFTGNVIDARRENEFDVVPVMLGPRAVGCIVAETP